MTFREYLREHGGEHHPPFGWEPPCKADRDEQEDWEEDSDADYNME